MISRRSRAVGVVLLSCLVGLLMVGLMTLTAQSAEAASPHVDVMLLNTDIGPASLNFLTHAINTAEQDGARALVIEIDTPGGDIDSMTSMTKEELKSTVPIITYVSPAGGRAASAGAFVELAAPIAAMAPATRIGASSPVTDTGGDIGSTLKAKIENDLIAAITGFQHRYGRNEGLVAAMVTGAASYDDATAIQQHIVDLGAPNLNVLLTAVNGRTALLSTGTVTLHTAGAQVQMLNESMLDEAYAFLLDPNVVFLLFIVAMIGIFLEVSHPGAIVPGVTGAIALILFLFAVGSLTPNWAGLALMVLAFVLLVLDVRLPAHGALTVGAVISLVVGALLFFNSNTTYGGPQLRPWVVYLMAGIIGAFGFTLVTIIVRAQRRRILTGKEGMIGATAIALTPLLPEGRVNYGGENWAAILEGPASSVDAGSEVRITAVEGLRLHVVPVQAQIAYIDPLTHTSHETLQER
jgi:membrane-bound serine protease (ClpP class)